MMEDQNVETPYNQTEFIDNELQILYDAENNNLNNTNLKDEARLFEKLEEVEAEKWVRHDEAVSIKQKLGVILDEMVQHQQFSESFFPKIKKDDSIKEMTRDQKIRKLYRCYFKYRDRHDQRNEINTLLVNNAVSIQDGSVMFIKRNFLNILRKWRDYVVKMGELVNKDGGDEHPNPFPLNFRNWLRDIITIFEHSSEGIEIEQTSHNTQLATDVLQLITFIKEYLIDYYVECWQKISDSNLTKNKRMQIGTLVNNMELDMLKMRKVLTKVVPHGDGSNLEVVAPSYGNQV